MTNLPYQLDRTVVIRATPETVFRFFTDSARWAKWWGPGSTIDAQPGGKVYIRHSNGIESLGEVLEAKAPERIVFITGDIANEETVATLRETGAPCVEKPFRVQQFISVVEKTMGKAL